MSLMPKTDRTQYRIQYLFETNRMEVISIGKRSSIDCLDCEDLLRKAKVSDTTIKFYQQEVNKCKRTNSELRVQKMDLMNQISQLNIKLCSLEDIIKQNGHQEYKQLMARQQDLQQQIKSLRKSSANQVQQASNKLVELQEVNYKLESQLRGLKVTIQQSDLKLFQCLEQVKKTSQQNQRLQNLLYTQKQIRLMMEQTIRGESFQDKEYVNQLHIQLKQAQVKLQTQGRQISILKSQIKSIEAQKCKTRDVSDSRIKELKMSLRQKNQQIQTLKDTLESEKRECIKYKQQLQRYKLKSIQANNKFSCQLIGLQNKIIEYNRLLERIQNQNRLLIEQNQKIRHKICQCSKRCLNKNKQPKIKQSDQSSEYKEKERQYYLSIVSQNIDLKIKIDVLTEQNNILITDNRKLRQQHEQQQKEIQNMKKQTFDLFQKLQLFQNKLKKNNTKIQMSQNIKSNQNNQLNSYNQSQKVDIKQEQLKLIQHTQQDKQLSDMDQLDMQDSDNDIYQSIQGSFDYQNDQSISSDNISPDQNLEQQQEIIQ